MAVKGLDNIKRVVGLNHKSMTVAETITDPLSSMNQGEISFYEQNKHLPMEEYQKKLSEKYIADATRDCPEGIICGHCGKINDNADDCGWWCCLNADEPLVRDEKGFLKNKGRPACKECHDGRHGELHRKLYGVGDR